MFEDFDRLPLPVIVFDTKGTAQETNHVFSAELLPANAPMPPDWRSMLCQESLPTWDDFLAKASLEPPLGTSQKLTLGLKPKSGPGICIGYDMHITYHRDIACYVAVLSKSTLPSISTVMTDFYQTIMDRLPVSVFALDKEGRIVLAAGGCAENVMGSNLKEGIGFPYLQSELKFEIREQLETALYKGQASQGICTHEDRWYDLHMLPMNIQTEENVCLCVGGFIFCHAYNFTELTERMGTAEAQRLKTDFVAKVSHEIRTPLTSIIGMTDLLRDTTMTEEQRQYADVTHKSAKLLLSLINNVLDLTKFETGNVRLEAHSFFLSALMEELQQIVYPLALEKKVKVELHKDFPASLRLVADTKCLRQAILNLLSNAIKFSRDNGIIKFNVSLVGRDFNQRRIVHVEIVDKGIGISKDTLSNLFQPFSQGRRISESYGGSGLGLSICKKIVEAFEGEIGADSILGVGSRFWMFLPLNEHLPTPATSPEESDAQSPFPLREDDYESEDYLQRSRRSILIAEDNPTNRVLLVKILQKLGYTNVVVTVDGTFAVEEYRKRLDSGDSLFDVVLLDQNMPEMCGDEAAKIIRKMFPHQVIIFVTANVMASHTVCNNVNDFITKPISIQELKKKLDKWITLNDARIAEERLKQVVM